MKLREIMTLIVGITILSLWILISLEKQAKEGKNNPPAIEQSIQE